MQFTSKDFYLPNWIAILLFFSKNDETFSTGADLAAATDRRAPAPRWHATQASQAQWQVWPRVNRARRQRDLTAVTGGSDHDGAAEIGLAGARRLHQSNLLDAGYAVVLYLDKIELKLFMFSSVY